MDDKTARMDSACILFDDAPVKHKRGVSRRLVSPTRCEEPILVPERSWEIDAWCGDPGASVVQDQDGTCHLWYMLKFADGGAKPPPLRKSASGPRNLAELQTPPRYILCYARSRDGVYWEKPDCGVFDLDGNPRNNIVLTGRLGGTAILDPNGGTDARFRMLHGDGPRIPWRKAEDNEPSRVQYNGIYAAVSADGVHWRKSEKPAMPWYTDTTNVVYWDDQREKYVAFVRWDGGMRYEDGMTVVHEPFNHRAIARCESADFFNFPPPKVILTPPRTLWHPPETGVDYYNSAAMKYPFAPNAYFLFISMFSHKTGRLDIYLASSRNGEDYEIWPEPFVELGLDGAFDARCMYMLAGIVDRGEMFYMYYRGYSYVHHCERHPASSFKTKGEPVGFGRLRVRKDGFVAQVFAPAGGELVTRPVEVAGNRLLVNCDAGARGELRVALLDEEGTALPGFARAACVPVWGNNWAAEVCWNGGDIASLRGRKVQLRFTGEAVRLFAFRFAEETKRE